MVEWEELSEEWTTTKLHTKKGIMGFHNFLCPEGTRKMEEENMKKMIISHF